MKSILHATMALFLLLASNGYAQSFKTELKVSEGQEYAYFNEVSIDITQTMGEKEVKVNTTGTATTKFVIDKILPTGNVEMFGSVWDLTSSTKMSMMDSAMSSSIKGQSGATYKLIVDKYGNSLSREKVDSTDTSKSMIDFGNRFSGTGIFCEFPENNIQPGGKWTRSVNDSIANMGTKVGVVIKTDYTLGGVESFDGNTYQKVTYISAIEIGGKGKSQGMEFFIEGTGVQNGDLFVHPVSKVIYSNHSDIELDMNVAVTGQQAMTIPMSQKMTVTQKLKK